MKVLEDFRVCKSSENIEDFTNEGCAMATPRNRPIGVQLAPAIILEHTNNNYNGYKEQDYHFCRGWAEGAPGQTSISSVLNLLPLGSSGP